MYPPQSGVSKLGLVVKSCGASSHGSLQVALASLKTDIPTKPSHIFWFSYVTWLVPTGNL
eukprot:6492582-Amphidinium_carterae.2